MSLMEIRERSHSQSAEHAIGNLSQGSTSQAENTVCGNFLGENKWRPTSSLIDHLPHHLSHQIWTTLYVRVVDLAM